MKKMFVFLGIALLVIIVIIVILLMPINPSENLKECPTSLIKNNMPAVFPSVNSDYYILNGERKEISDFDAEWVSANCEVEVLEVS
jgi:hypothetical protein